MSCPHAEVTEEILDLFVLELSDRHAPTYLNPTTTIERCCTCGRVVAITESGPHHVERTVLLPRGKS
mgnify:CR=1 FL=1